MLLIGSFPIPSSDRLSSTEEIRQKTDLGQFLMTARHGLIITSGMAGDETSATVVWHVGGRGILFSCLFLLSFFKRDEILPMKRVLDESPTCETSYLRIHIYKWTWVIEREREEKNVTDRRNKRRRIWKKKGGRKVVVAFLGNSFNSLLSSIGRSRTRRKRGEPGRWFTTQNRWKKR